MKELKRIPLDEGVGYYLQALGYEADGYRVLNVQAMEAGLSKAQRGGLLDRYRDINKKYRAALDEIIVELAPEVGKPGISCYVDFMEMELILQEAG